MILRIFKTLGLFVAVVLILPILVILGYFTHLYVVSAFPSDSLAVERFEESGLYEFPKDAKDLYFRIGIPSPLDRGGSALRFSTGDDELTKILSTVPPGYEWQSLEREFLCSCFGCIRYADPVEVPAGSLYWRHDSGTSNYKLLAVNLQTKQVFRCDQDI